MSAGLPPIARLGWADGGMGAVLEVEGEVGAGDRAGEAGWGAFRVADAVGPAERPV